jgi:FKBP-type peptidyl-prolyl cis-trans isomerase 2
MKISVQNFKSIAMQVKKDTVVTMRYTMKDSQGDVMEDTMNNSPVQYLHGCGIMLASLESLLEGLTAGQQRSFTVNEKQWNKPLHFEVVIDEVRIATDEEIKMRRPMNNECGPDCCY